MDALTRTLSITAVSMATIFGVMAFLYVTIKVLVRAEDGRQS